MAKAVSLGRPMVRPNNAAPPLSDLGLSEMEQAQIDEQIYATIHMDKCEAAMYQAEMDSSSTKALLPSALSKRPRLAANEVVEEVEAPTGPISDIATQIEAALAQVSASGQEPGPFFPAGL